MIICNRPYPLDDGGDGGDRGDEGDGGVGGDGGDGVIGMKVNVICEAVEVILRFLARDGTGRTNRRKYKRSSRT